MTQDDLDRCLALLGEELVAKGTNRVDLVVCGGCAILSQQLGLRTTMDVDILARLDEAGQLILAEPLPDAIRMAADSVARLLHLAPDWLNTGPALQLAAGLPNGFRSRLVRKDFGSSLRIYFTGRYDLIHLKLFAAVDQGPGKHVTDLHGLSPSNEEMFAAAKWVITQDAAEDFHRIVARTLEQLGYKDVAARL